MLVCSTITKYLTRKFSWYLFLISLIIIVVLVISNAFGILQKFKSVYIQPKDFWFLVLLKIPYLFNEISTIVGFISTMLFLRYLSNNNELIVLISSGLSIWRIFTVPIILSFVFGVIIIAIINPIATYSLKEYEELEAKLSNSMSQSSFFISDSGIFFYEEYQKDRRIIQVHSINVATKSISEMTILIVDSQNQLIQRIDTPYAELNNKQFYLHTPIISTTNGSATFPQLSLRTNLSIDTLLQKFTSPQMVPIWNLPELINKLTRMGLPTLSYQIHFFKQLFKPAAMSAMVLLAFGFLNFDNRTSKIKTTAFALITGVFTYFSLEITLRILVYGGLNPIFATLLPILFIILISNFVILHSQES
ncbi:MAG: LptF/LptG family permease [Rickettsiaceae bacterium]